MGGFEPLALDFLYNMHIHPGKISNVVCFRGRNADMLLSLALGWRHLPKRDKNSMALQLDLLVAICTLMGVAGTGLPLTE